MTPQTIRPRSSPRRGDLVRGLLGRRHAAAALVMAVVVSALSWVGLPRAAPAPNVNLGMTLLRVLSYDTNLKARAGEAVVMAVLFRLDAGASKREGVEMVRLFRELEAVPVQGLPFRVISLAVDDTNALEQSAKDAGVSVFFLCAGLEDDVGTIKQIARSKKIRVTAAREAYTSKGVSVIVDPEAAPSITVNLKSSRDEGADFSSGLLRLAKVIR